MRVGISRMGRSIPACAGEPQDYPAFLQQRQVYPRVCGGTRLPQFPDGFVQGLSPRVRGNHYPGRGACLSLRSIPACAGEPGGELGHIENHAVYPRVCGGTERMAVRLQAMRGLSPRVRGNRPAAGAGVLRLRSIPACAGEPPSATNWHSSLQVYPRVCGGTTPPDTSSKAIEGLSPRVRGNRASSRLCSTGLRSIPACAGEPGQLPLVLNRAEVYPRVCGGTVARRREQGSGRGLSPRVRGNPDVYIIAVHIGRSIPACAGEPRLSTMPAWSLWVYPRVCGGTHCRHCPDFEREGLSPRVRGNRGFR